MKIDRRRLDQLASFAERLGYRILHIHADVKTPPYPYVKLSLEQRDGEKKKHGKKRR